MINRSALKTIFISFILGASAFAHADTPNTVPQAVQDSLIEWSVADFSKHGPSVTGVRNVHIRSQPLANGEPSYLLCGEFRSSSDVQGAEWTDFATIKTDPPYEQWIGSMAKTQCEHATASTTQPQDLSAVLQARLDAIRVK